jgi:protein-ribulosamine 3-kinase
MLPEPLQQLLTAHYGKFTAQPVSGGCINATFKLVTKAQPLFVKFNNATKFPGMLQSEEMGLRLMAETGTVNIPRIIEYGIVEELDYLILEFIEPGEAGGKVMEELGRNVAAMHQCSNPQFGLPFNNYLGSLPQSNTPNNNWAEFFITARLQPMVKLAMDGGYLHETDVADFEKLYSKLPQLFPDEKPALLHGDLWSGNYLTDANGKPYLMDPAVYYGHREMDIAMTLLFEYFAPEFYEAYNEAYPLQPNWRERVALCNLYPLLAHVNLFGRGYAAQVKACLRKYL